jgi:hypothetical protein
MERDNLIASFVVGFGLLALFSLIGFTSYANMMREKRERDKTVKIEQLEKENALLRTLIGLKKDE